MVKTEDKLKEEIEKKFYKLKSDDKLTLTGKQLKEFAEYNRQEVKQKIIKEIRELPNPMMCDWNSFIKWKQKLLNSLGEKQ